MQLVKSDSPQMQITIPGNAVRTHHLPLLLPRHSQNSLEPCPRRLILLSSSVSVIIALVPPQGTYIFHLEVDFCPSSALHLIGLPL